MSAPQRRWEPANEVERRMQAAWSVGDANGFAELLVQAPLYLPSFPTEPDGTQRLLRRQRDGDTYVLAFTSVESLREAVAHLGAGWRLTTFMELVNARPDASWGLVISPQTPIGAYLEAAQLEQMSLLADVEEPFHAADETERLMRLAQQTGEPSTYLDVLLISTVLLPVSAPAAAADLEHDGFPYVITYRDGLPTISVFTSLARLHESMPGDVRTVEVGFASVVRTWPDLRYRLAVNPDSAIDAIFTGGQLPDLWNWAQNLLVREGLVEAGPDEGSGVAATQAGATPAPVDRSGVPDLPPVSVATPERVEVTVGEPEVDRYLVEGYDRVTGSVRALGQQVVEFGHLVRWYQDLTALPADLALVDWVLPHGAQLIRLVAAEEVVLASYDSELHRWNPAIGTVLRGFTT